MTKEDKLYADKLRNKAISDYERLNLAINELEKTEQARGMTREQAINYLKSSGVRIRMTRTEAINYLKSSGMSEKQIETVINAFTCEDAISRQAVLDKLEKPMNWTDSEAELQEQRDYEGFVELVKSMPSVTPKAESEVEE